MKIVTNNIPIYGSKWKIIFVDSLKEIASKYDLRDDENYDAVCFIFEGDYYTAFEIKEITPGLIAHEAKHLVNQIFIHCDVLLDRHNDEPECFLLSWIINRIHENMPKKKNLKRQQE